MTTAEFLDYMNSGKQVTAECGVHRTMHKLSQDAIRITMQINNCYHTPDEINELMSELVGEPVEVGLFPPFYTDCGKNIHLGKGVSTQNCEDRYSVVISVSQLTISTLFSNRHSSLFCFVSFCFLILLYIGLTPFNFGQQKNPSSENFGRRICDQYSILSSSGVKLSYCHQGITTPWFNRTHFCPLVK